MYDAIELDEIFNSLDHRLTDEEFGMLQKKFPDGVPNHLMPFVALAATRPDLYAKLEDDARLRSYSIYGLLPETFPLVYGSETSPVTRTGSGNRGLVAIFQHPTKNVVVKPIQSPRERDIAVRASNLLAGPAQLPTRKHFITEEYIDAPLFTQLKRPSEELLYTTGRRLGDIMNALHRDGIYYNDTSVADDMGRSHVFVPADRSALLFDYGVALDTANISQWSDEEVIDYIRTMPGMNLAFAMQDSPQFRQQIVSQHGADVRRLTREQVLSRDLSFLDEGIYLASMRMGALGAFAEGLRETLRD